MQLNLVDSFSGTTLTDSVQGGVMAALWRLTRAGYLAKFLGPLQFQGDADFMTALPFQADFTKLGYERGGTLEYQGVSIRPIGG